MTFYLPYPYILDLQSSPMLRIYSVNKLSQSLLFLLFLLASRNSTLFYLQVAKKWQNLLFFGPVGIKKNRKCSKFPKTQNKPIKFFFEFCRGRSELQTRNNIRNIEEYKIVSLANALCTISNQ